ncbi:ISL3 family transposase, partial [Streptomyces hydrogenans]
PPPQLPGLSRTRRRPLLLQAAHPPHHIGHGLKNILARCPQLDTVAGRVRDFGEILTARLGATLPIWIAADAGQLPGLTGFALHLLRDLDAVTAGLTPDWSSGSIEGAINRIKKIKQQLCGRAGFGLLRKMIPLQ